MKKNTIFTFYKEATGNKNGGSSDRDHDEVMVALEIGTREVPSQMA